MLRTLAPALVALAFAAAAAAQPALRTPHDPPTEAARTEAARLVAEVGAADLFDDASNGQLPGARHISSGLVCRFEPGAEMNKIMIFPSEMPRGDDVGCTTAAGTIVVTVYATRFPSAATAEGLMEGAVAAIRKRWPDAKPFSGEVTNAGLDANQLPPGAGERLRERWTIAIDGQPTLTKVDLIQVGPWTYKQRATGPLDGPTDLHSELNFAGVMLDLPGRPETPR